MSLLASVRLCLFLFMMFEVSCASRIQRFVSGSLPLPIDDKRFKAKDFHMGLGKRVYVFDPSKFHMGLGKRTPEELPEKKSRLIFIPLLYSIINLDDANDQ